MTVTMFDNSMVSTKKTFTFKTAPPKPSAASGILSKISTGNTGATAATTLHIYNLKPSYPPSWISLNQIGFDSVNLLASTIHRLSSNNPNTTEYILWIAAGLLNHDGTISLDPTTPTLAPGTLTVYNRDNVTFELVSQFSLITGGPPIPMAGFTIASHFDVVPAVDNTGTFTTTSGGESNNPSSSAAFLSSSSSSSSVRIRVWNPESA
ncbi:hypothetical protein BDR26DRAFT_128508 [Obelidium mucronatum]|nr:hypothetical protein BDR26DRAFT_128508 [Obelidium mucronatum]